MAVALRLIDGLTDERKQGIDVKPLKCAVNTEFIWSTDVNMATHAWHTVQSEHYL